MLSEKNPESADGEGILLERKAEENGTSNEL
jgi:hypothetical protein